MFAIDHAATALLVKRRFPAVSMVLLLLSVQLMEILWVLLNFAGIERTTTEATVRSVSDIHLAYMPYSHSIAAGVVLSLASWLIVSKFSREPSAGLAVGLGVLSHLILDLLTHAPDIAIAPGIDQPKFGLGLYSSAPLAAFALEMVYGVFCWLVYRGRKSLLLVIVLFNLVNLPLFSPSIPGPTQFLAGRPMFVVGLVAIQIAVTLIAVGFYSRRNLC